MVEVGKLADSQKNIQHYRTIAQLVRATALSHVKEFDMVEVGKTADIKHNQRFTGP